MTVAPYEWERRRFCSRACLGMENVERLNRIRKPPALYAKPPVMRGEDHPKWKEPLIHICKHCQQEFKVDRWRLKDKGHTAEYCSVKCRGAYRKAHLSGPDSPHWVGGITTYRGKGWREARLKAVRRDGGKCADCGRVVGDSISVHHIKPFREFATATEANHVDNLICLCQSCHMKREPRRKNGQMCAPPASGPDS